MPGVYRISPTGAPNLCRPPSLNMNILWITLEPILPANTGGRIGVFKRVEYLSKSNTIYLFAPYDNESDLRYIDQAKKYCREVCYYKRNKGFFTLLKSLFLPFTVSSRIIPNMKRDIADCLKNKQIDLINIDFPHMCYSIDAKKTDAPIVLNEHNVEWMFYKNIAKSSPNPIKKLAYWIDSFRLKKAEERLHRKIRFSLVTFVSKKDMDFYRRWMKASERLCLVPPGAEEHQIARGKKKKSTILFVGKMSAMPNVEGVEWFCTRVMPAIKKEIPDAVFEIVGKDPSSNIKKLSNDHIRVAGTVDSVSDYYASASLVVLPLLHGGGVKIKLLEAASYGSPIVSTSVGVEGTDFEDGVHALVADDDSTFAQQCIRLLKDDKLSSTLSQNALNLFKQKYLWEKICEGYERELEKCL